MSKKMIRHTARQRECLEAIGITCWAEQDDTHSENARSVIQPGEAPLQDHASLPVNASWDELQQQVKQCTACELHRTRTQTVFGTGNQNADLLFIGEAPGADEDRQGEPFVGRAGQLLNEMLKAIGLRRSDVYIANILKCRPPNNRDPKPEEAAQCAPFLYRQIELIEPKVMVALGRIAAQRLLRTDTALSRLRGKLHNHPETGAKLIVTYHPAYLLRSPAEKRKAWEDLIFIKNTIESVS
jgi:uracil-DNA glycosylase family 4